MTSPSALLLGECSICGEPIYRHRLPSGRQITCDQLRRIDQEFLQSTAQPAHQPDRQFQVIAGGRDRDRALVDPTLHAGEV